MYKKFFSVLLILIALVFTLSLHPVLAKNDKKPDVSFVPPEAEGTYDVPGHPDMKVRVFVYRAKGTGGRKPAPSPTPVSAPDCTLSDPDSLAQDGITGWHLPTSWKYNLNSGSVPSSVGSGNLSTIATSSFAAWTNAISGRVSMTSGASTSATRSRFDGLNIIAWGRTSRSALAVTYTWYYTNTGEVADVDTIMNVSFPWSWGGGSATCAYPNSYDAQNILTHELGHWMGLDDKYTEEFINNTMYGYGSPREAKKDTLTSGDIAGLLTIYQTSL